MEAPHAAVVPPAWHPLHHPAHLPRQPCQGEGRRFEPGVPLQVFRSPVLFGAGLLHERRSSRRRLGFTGIARPPAATENFRQLSEPKFPPSRVWSTAWNTGGTLRATSLSGGELDHAWTLAPHQAGEDRRRQGGSSRRFPRLRFPAVAGVQRRGSGSRRSLRRACAAWSRCRSRPGSHAAPNSRSQRKLDASALARLGSQR